MPGKEHYKAVLIVGSNIIINDEIRKLYAQKEYLLLGDGLTNLHKLSLGALKGKIGPTTRITVYAHGIAEKGIHYMDGEKTANILTILNKCSEDSALNIDINSCYAGAAAPDIAVLAKGSLLIAHGEEEQTLVALNEEVILLSNADISSEDRIKDFNKQFFLHIKHTATVSIKRDNGKVAKHAIRPPYALLSDPIEIVRFFEYQRNEFVKYYNDSVAAEKRIDIGALPPLKEEDAWKWKKDYFLYLSSLKSKEKIIIEALHSKSLAFLDCIMHKSSAMGITALMLAAEKGLADAVGVILAATPKENLIEVINAQNIDGYTALIRAAKKGRADIVAKILAATPKENLIEVINAQDKYGCTALIYAAENGHADVIVKILAATPKENLIEVINAQDQDGNTALIWATENGHADVVAQILAATPAENLIDMINAQNTEGYTALIRAAKKGRTDVIAEILSATPAENLIEVINAQDKDGNTALIWAAKNGHADVVAEILAATPVEKLIEVIDTRDKSDNTAFAWAAFCGKGQVIKKILEATPKKNSIEVINAQDKDGKTALMMAIKIGHIDMINEILTVIPAENLMEVMNTKDKDGFTAFQRAVEKGDEKVIKALEEKPEIRRLIGAAKHGDAKSIKETLATILKENLVEVINATDKDGNTALIWAAKNGHADAVNEILAVTPEKNLMEVMNAKGELGLTALQQAIKRGDEKVIKALEEKPEVRKLLWALKHGDDYIIKKISAVIPAEIFIKIMNTTDEKGHTPFTWALFIASAKLITAILYAYPKDKLGELLLKKNKFGDTPLLYAIKKGDVDMVKEILSFLLEVTPKTNLIEFLNAQNKQGNTALMIAAENGQVEMIKLLLNACPNANTPDLLLKKNKHGQAAITLIKDTEQQKEIIHKISQLPYEMQKEIIEKRDVEKIAPPEHDALADYKEVLAQKDGHLMVLIELVKLANRSDYVKGCLAKTTTMELCMEKLAKKDKDLHQLALHVLEGADLPKNEKLCVLFKKAQACMPERLEAFEEEVDLTIARLHNGATKMVSSSGISIA